MSRDAVISSCIHSDKNPHPDAKRAFEALATAYEVLTNSEERKAYDASYVTFRKHQRSLRYIFGMASEAMENMHARVLLLLARCRRGEIGVELAQLVDVIRANMKNCGATF